MLTSVQVRCDRQDPCGNCQDAEISCRRQRSTKRRRLNRQNSSPGSSRGSRFRTIADHEFDELIISSNETMPFLPLSHAMSYHEPHTIQGPPRILYDPVHDAQLTIQHQLRHLPGLAYDRRSVLETALSVISVLSDNSRIITQDTQSGHVGAGSPRVPPTEFLAWMLKGTSTPYVSFPTEMKS